MEMQIEKSNSDKALNQTFNLKSNTIKKKLSEAVVSSLKQDYNNGLRITDLSLKYGVHLSTISRIIQGLIWKDVEPLILEENSINKVEKEKKDVTKNKSYNIQIIINKILHKSTFFAANPNSACIIYNGSKNKAKKHTNTKNNKDTKEESGHNVNNAIGLIYFKGKSTSVSKIMYEYEHKRELGKNEIIKHICNNNSCVNVEHMDVHVVNKNPDTRQYGSRLTHEQRKSLVEDIVKGLSISEIATKYKITQASVYRYAQKI